MILLLTAGFGDGHNTAANSTAVALREELADTGEVVEVVDLFEEAMPKLTGVLRSLYQLAIINFPWAWRLVYEKLAESEIGRREGVLHRLMQDALEKRIRCDAPRVLVSTYPIYSSLLRAVRQRCEVPPLVTVITDSVSVHSAWHADPSDLFCVADEETAQVLRDRGVAPSIVRVTGFPVHPAFAKPPATLRPVDGPQRVLYLPSTPVTHVGATLEKLRPILASGVRLTVAAGKHSSRLHHTLVRFIDSLPSGWMDRIGWTDQMPDLLRQHDLIICKAGGAILHEVLAARTPAIIDYVVPGQEEGNAEMLLRHQCARRSHTPEETAALVAEMLADQGRLLGEMRTQMVPPLSLPDAARAIAGVVLGQVIPNALPPHSTHSP